MLYFAAEGLEPKDQIAVHLNGFPMTDDQRDYRDGGRPKESGRPLKAGTLVPFELTQPALKV